MIIGLKLYKIYPLCKSALSDIPRLNIRLLRRYVFILRRFVFASNDTIWHSLAVVVILPMAVLKYVMNMDATQMRVQALGPP